MTFRIDMHIHTGRYSQCAELVDPVDLGPAAVAAGMDAIVITDHDVQWGRQEILELETESGPRVFRGLEWSAAGCHALVIGLQLEGRVDRYTSLETICQLANDEGAAVILAHPYRDTDLDRLPVHLVHAIEISSTSFVGDATARSIELAWRLGKPTVANSDAHALCRIGWAWNELDEMPQDELALAQLIREGQIRAVCHDELAYGASSLTADDRDR